MPALQADSHGIQIHSAPAPLYMFNRCWPGHVTRATKTNVFIGRAFVTWTFDRKVPGGPRPPIKPILFLCFRLSGTTFVKMVCTELLNTSIRPKKKNCYVALTRPKSENWVGRSIFLIFFFFFNVP